MSVIQGHWEYIYIFVLDWQITTNKGCNWIWCPESWFWAFYMLTCDMVGRVPHKRELPSSKWQECPCLKDWVQVIVWVMKILRPDTSQVNKKAMNEADLYVYLEWNQVSFFSYANFNSSCTGDVKRPFPIYRRRTNQNLLYVLGIYFILFPLGTRNLIFPTNKMAQKWKKNNEK